MKSMKRLGLSAFLVILAGILALVSTYAWFTASQNARAEGLELTATVPNSLQISADNNQWGETARLNSEITEMIPVSSALGYNDTFYYIPVYEGAGGVFDSDDVFSAVQVTDLISNDAAYYIDIPIYLKLIASYEDATIRVSSVTVSSTSSASSELANAYRVAVFDGPSSEAGQDTLLYFGGNNLNAVQVYPMAGESALAENASVSQSSPFRVSDDSAVRLTVRIWLEGQDPRCINVNANDAVKVTIQFEGAS